MHPQRRKHRRRLQRDDRVARARLEHGGRRGQLAHLVRRSLERDLRDGRAVVRAHVRDCGGRSRPGRHFERRADRRVGDSSFRRSRTADTSVATRRPARRTRRGTIQRPHRDAPARSRHRPRDPGRRAVHVRARRSRTSGDSAADGARRRLYARSATHGSPSKVIRTTLPYKAEHSTRTGRSQPHARTRSRASCSSRASHQTGCSR